VIPYTIILTGPIGAGKTTLSHIFTSYLKSKDKNVHLISEAALMDSRALKIFYEERNKTDDILERIKHLIESFSRISHQFDVVILDRTPLDTKVFTKMNISNLDYVTFLNSYVSFIELNIDKVVFVQPEFSITVDRVKNRNRSGETCSEDYLHDLFNLYQNDIYEIYPKNKG
ncbi:11364_t:CDS:2, partial [Dentiscutata erythropus]